MEYSGLYNATNDSPEYAQALLSKLFHLLSNGVAYNYGNELQVSKVAGLQVVVDSGGMTSKGMFYVQDADANGGSPLTFTHDAASAGYLRKDRIVIEFDTNNANAAAKIVKGTESVSNPTAPNLTDTNAKWQVSLGIVNIEGSSLVADNEIEDEREIGDGRTNPAFKEDISAPNMILESGGKIYLKKADTEPASMYIKGDISSNKLIYKGINVSEVQAAFVLSGTSETPPTGTYPEGTMYLEYEDE